MSSETRNRGKQSNDDKLFSEKWKPIFTKAIDDLSFLYTRGYGEKSALQLVGNRYQLNVRQQKALGRISEAQQDIELRKSKELSIDQLANEKVAIDGFNLLILLESALSGAYVFKCRDNNYRDISGVHGSYKRVIKTEHSLLTIGNTLNDLKVKHVQWYLDAPISNSGRLKTIMRETAEQNNFPWEIFLVNNPDRTLAELDVIVVSSDGWVLNHSARWFNLGAYLLENKISDSTIFIA